MKPLIGRFLLALVWQVIFFPPSSSLAEESRISPEAYAANQKANQQCMECHALQALEHPPRAGLDLQKLRAAIRDPKVFANSVHGRLACTMCHNEGYDAYPHAEDGKDMTSVCADCHWRKTRVIEAEYEQSVHAKHLIDRITCLTCHDPHTVRTARQVVEPRKIVAQDNRVCLGCHDSDFTFAQYAPEQKSRPDIDEVHQWLPNARRHWKAVRCIECHTRTEREMVSHKILDKSQANKKCVLCHSANSELLHTLYRHLAQEEQRKYGFLNSVILGNSYVISATRHPTLDSIILALIKLTVAGVLLHGLLRYVAARIRRKKHHE